MDLSRIYLAVIRSDLMRQVCFKFCQNLGKGCIFLLGVGLQVPFPHFFHRHCHSCSKYGLLSADFQVMLTKVNNKLGGEINKMRCGH